MESRRLAMFSAALVFLCSVPRASAVNALICTPDVSVVRTIRWEGLTELISDVVLRCTGGTSTPAGQSIPKADISLLSDGNITSRLVGSAGYPEALLIIDEPGTTNNSNSLRLCDTVCDIKGPPPATDPYDGTSGRPNVFHASSITTNKLTFSSIPVEPPGSGTRILRFTNIRVGGLPISQTLVPTGVQVAFSVSPPNVLPVNHPMVTAAFVGNGIAFSLRDGSDSSPLSSATFIVPANSQPIASSAPSAFLRFREGFPNAFLTRTSASYAGMNVSPPPAQQNTPGTVYMSESGFTISAFGGTMGLANSGTRLKGSFQNFPPGVRVWVGVVNSGAGTGVARLITGEATPFIAASASGTLGGYAVQEVDLVNGSGTAVWEVLAADGYAVESFDIPVWFGNSGTAPAAGTIHGSLAPNSSNGAFDDDEGMGPSDTLPVPRFADASALNATVPSPVSVLPAFGSGLPQNMNFRFNDFRGWQDLGVVNILINDFLDGRNACYLAYSQPLHVLYLVNDSGGALLPGLSLNGAGSTGNSQCTVSWNAGAGSGSGEDLSLNLTVSFQAGFKGNRIVYMAAGDAAGHNSGWQALGVWRVPGPANATSPAVTGMTPARGSAYGNSSAAYTFSFSDTNGYQHMGVENILINNFLDGRHACYLAYSRPMNVLYLVNDNGDGLLPGKLLNTGGTLANSQCSVSWGNNAVTISGNDLSLTLSISFTPAFAGNRVCYLAARDVNEGNNTGWQAWGTWTIE